MFENTLPSAFNALNNVALSHVLLKLFVVRRLTAAKLGQLKFVVQKPALEDVNKTRRPEQNSVRHKGEAGKLEGYRAIRTLT